MEIEEFWMNIPDQGEAGHMQKIVFAAGHTWYSGATCVLNTGRKWFHFSKDDLEPRATLTYASLGTAADGSKLTATITYKAFVAKYGHILKPCNTGAEDVYDG